tara:strand:- start:712 stop:969 length:258 start_codon:yes stop_codon:yes gene_type:complete
MIDRVDTAAGSKLERPSKSRPENEVAAKVAAREKMRITIATGFDDSLPSKVGAEVVLPINQSSLHPHRTSPPRGRMGADRIRDRD